jgi:hypothetical protein
MKRIVKLLFVVMMCLVVQQAWSQTSFTAKLYITDGILGDTLTMGFDSTATSGLDPILGEVELPPPPPALGPFDARFINPHGDTSGYGSGRKIDYRDALLNIQNDTFMVKVHKAPEATDITISWNANIGDVGPGDIRWEIYDFSGLTLLAIMNNQSSITITDFDEFNVQQVRIVRRDGAHFRTLTMSDWATAVDQKGKSKGVKQKPVASHFKFTMTNTTGTAATKLVVKFGAVITELVSYSPFTTAAGVGSKEVTFTGATINPNGTVTIEGFGDKGKAMKAKGTWYSATDTKLKPAPTATFDFNFGLLPMPNSINVGEELYSQSAFGSSGVVVGLSGKINSVYHPKYKDVMKTFYSKGAAHTGAAKCLLNFDSGKPLKKAVKGMPSAKHNNVLLAEQLALKLNIALADNDKVDATYAFGDLIYNGSITSLQGKYIRQIADQIDSVLSCVETDTTFIKDSSLTFADWYNVAKTLNDEFATDFDTASWAGKLVLTAPISIADGANSYLVRDPNLVPITRAPRPVVESNVPERFELQQNYPNPFNPTTTIEFTLPQDAAVTIAVYNMLGQQVAMVADHEEFTEGANDVEFDASHLASGVYFYRITVNNIETGKALFSSAKKMMLVK